LAVIIAVILVVIVPVQMQEPTNVAEFIDNLEEGIPVRPKHWDRLSLVSIG
jgi:hypothetical protein